MSGSEPSAASGTVATVLVVDEDVLVRAAIAAYLRDCGYRVIEAAGVAEAQAVIAHDHDGEIAAVLSDAEMSGELGGFGLARWIRERRAGLEVILAASPRRAADAAGELCEQGPMLARPYDPQLVLDRIRRLLAQRPPNGE